MSNGIASLADYQDWLNTIKQQAQSARVRVALAAKPNVSPLIREVFWQRPVAKIGQQRVDQIPSIRWHVTGFAS